MNKWRSCCRGRQGTQGEKLVIYQKTFLPSVIKSLFNSPFKAEFTLLVEEVITEGSTKY